MIDVSNDAEVPDPLHWDLQGGRQGTCVVTFAWVQLYDYMMSIDQLSHAVAAVMSSIYTLLVPIAAQPGCESCALQYAVVGPCHDCS